MTVVDYEAVRQLVEEVPKAASRGVRDIVWTTDAHVVGVARNDAGQVELFLAGEELHPTSATVADALEFHSWHRKDAPSFDANRLLLPALGHYDQVAAFLCTELLRYGADTSLARAFARTEPLIELAIERLRLSDQAIVGLAGELLVLDALCRHCEDAQVPAVVESWHGWRRSHRDFSLGATGIEVKTTRRAASSHLIEGVHQLERSDGSEGEAAEDRLYLVSIGLVEAEFGSDGTSVPKLVDRVMNRLEDSGNGSAVDKFLAHVSEYGISSGNGYDHRANAFDPAYATQFQVAFFRAYDMDGEGVKVLRTSDLVSHPHVDINSVKFRIELPILLEYGNPIAGANKVAKAILGAE